MSLLKKKKSTDIWFENSSNSIDSSYKISDDSKIAVIGGGPAGAFFSYFFMDYADKIGIKPHLQIFERKEFSNFGPKGCNMCGGIISETLVQTLATEGINLPSKIVERGIDSYALHMNLGSIRIETPLREKRIAAVHRGAGPKGLTDSAWESFDKFLLDKAINKGAEIKHTSVINIELVQGKPFITTKDEDNLEFDLVVFASGVNTNLFKIFDQVEIKYKPPKLTKTYISEFYLGKDLITKQLGDSMHVFLLDIPRLEFAALIPKGDFVTLALLGKDIDDELINQFLTSTAVKECMPANWQLPDKFCHCSPKMNIGSAVEPFADRMVFIGDTATSRLFKDGIGAAYKTAKAAAATAVFDGFSQMNFRKRYYPVCKSIERDNKVGKFIFFITSLIQGRPHDERGLLRMVKKEQNDKKRKLRMSMVMWDLFTGSASYTEIFFRTLHPGFLWNLGKEVVLGIFSFDRKSFKLDPLNKEPVIE